MTSLKISDLEIVPVLLTLHATGEGRPNSRLAATLHNITPISATAGAINRTRCKVKNMAATLPKKMQKGEL